MYFNGSMTPHHLANSHTYDCIYPELIISWCYSSVAAGRDFLEMRIRQYGYNKDMLAFGCSIQCTLYGMMYKQSNAPIVRVNPNGT